MRLIRRSSRRFASRRMDYTYPELRSAHTPTRAGMLERPVNGAAAFEKLNSSRDERR